MHTISHNLNRETNRPQDKVPQQSPIAFSVPCSHLQARRTSSPQSPNNSESFSRCLFLSIACFQRTNAEGMCRFMPLYSLTWRLYRLNLKSLSAQICRIIVQQRYTPNRVLTFGCPHLKCIGNVGQCLTPGLTRYITVCICAS